MNGRREGRGETGVEGNKERGEKVALGIEREGRTEGGESCVRNGEKI